MPRHKPETTDQLKQEILGSMPDTRCTPASVAACLTRTSRPQGGLPPASGAYGRPGLCTYMTASAATHGWGAVLLVPYLVLSSVPHSARWVLLSVPFRQGADACQTVR
jgi:hypothetical protein